MSYGYNIMTTSADVVFASTGDYDYAYDTTYRYKTQKQRQNPLPVTYYVLKADGQTPVIESDAAKWAIWMAHCPQRVLQQDTLPDGTWVSTVFIGVQKGNEKALWESIVANNATELLGATHFYATYEAAKAGHRALLAMLGAFGRAIVLREEEHK